MTLIFLSLKIFWFSAGSHSGNKYTSFSHNFHIFRTQHSHLRITTSTSQDHNCSWLQLLYCVNSIVIGVVIQRCGRNACLKKKKLWKKEKAAIITNQNATIPHIFLWSLTTSFKYNINDKISTTLRTASRTTSRTTSRTSSKTKSSATPNQPQ